MDTTDSIKNRSTNVQLCHYQIAAYALLKHAMVPKYNPKPGQKHVLLFFSAHIGDVVIFLDTLKRYQSFYSEKNGYHLVFACRKEVWAFLSAMDCVGDMEFIEVNRDEILRSYPKFKKAVEDASKYHYALYINPRIVSIIEYIFDYCLCANERHIVRIKNDQSKSSRKESIFKDGKRYNAIEVDRTTMLLKRFGLLADRLTGMHEAIHISRLKVPSVDLDISGRYMVFAPSTAETPSKCWNKAHYAKLIDEVIDRYDIDIYLSGGKADRPVCQEIVKLIHHKDRVHDFVGKTSFQEWIALIAGAELVVCNDSSPMHIAASVGTKCVCIGGQWEGGCYYPYVVEEIRPDETLPVVVLGDKLPCYYCTTSVHGRKGNPDCKRAMEEAAPYPCIENVGYDEVMRAFKTLI